MKDKRNKVLSHIVLRQLRTIYHIYYESICEGRLISENIQSQLHIRLTTKLIMCFKGFTY